MLKVKSSTIPFECNLLNERKLGEKRIGTNHVKNTKNRTKAINQKYKKADHTGLKHYYLQNIFRRLTDKNKIIH